MPKKELTKRQRSLIDKMHVDGWSPYIISRVMKRPETEIEIITSDLPDNSEARRAKEERLNQIVNAQQSSRKWSFRNPKTRQITRLYQLADADQKALALEKQIVGLQGHYELITNKERRLSLKSLKSILNS